jgi:hypothetical protein
MLTTQSDRLPYVGMILAFSVLFSIQWIARPRAKNQGAIFMVAVFFLIFCSEDIVKRYGGGRRRRRRRRRSGMDGTRDAGKIYAENTSS